MDEMFYSLKREVIDPGFCVLCGSCSAFCDRIRLDYEKEKPLLVKPCVPGCSNCYDSCPIRVDFKPAHIFGKDKADPSLGVYREIKAVRAVDDKMRKRGQDGGAVTAILSAILDRKKVDAAVVVGRDSNWMPEPHIVTSKEELMSFQGSKYSPSPNIESLGRIFRSMDIKSVAVVDVGCHMRGIRNLEYGLLYNAGFSPYSDIKIYTIGLFCMGSFYRSRLIPLLKAEPAKIRKMDVKGSRLVVEADDMLTMNISDVKAATMPSCLLCADATAENADISIGSVGSPEGYSTVIVRNLMGWGMLRDAVSRGYAEADESLVDMGVLRRMADKKKRSVSERVAEAVNKKKTIPGFILSRNQAQ